MIATDGSEPTWQSNKYESPLRLEKTTSLRAIAMNESRVASAVLEGTYKIWNVLYAVDAGDKNPKNPEEPLGVWHSVEDQAYGVDLVVSNDASNDLVRRWGFVEDSVQVATSWNEQHRNGSNRRGWQRLKNSPSSPLFNSFSYIFELEQRDSEERIRTYDVTVGVRFSPGFSGGNQGLATCPGTMELRLYKDAKGDMFSPDKMILLDRTRLRSTTVTKKLRGRFSSQDLYVAEDDNDFRVVRIAVVSTQAKYDKATKQCMGNWTWDAPISFIDLRRLID